MKKEPKCPNSPDGQHHGRMLDKYNDAAETLIMQFKCDDCDFEKDMDISTLEVRDHQ